MSRQLTSRYAQTVMAIEFSFSFDDTMVNTAGAVIDFGKTATGTIAFDVAHLPVDSVVIGGHLVTDTAFDTASYAVSVGDAADVDRYLTTVDRKSQGVSALTPTGHRTSGAPVRLTVTNADVCTTGKATLRLMYLVTGRGTENAF